ncbi:MAG: restriction endonuclease subunit S [Candidatus Pacearchaeota archaeon]
MIAYSIILKSQLEGALRLDAEYYQPEYLKVAKLLKDYKPLKNFVEKIIHPQEVKREYSNTGYLFVLSQNLRENYFDFSEKFFIGESTSKQITKNLLKKGDILTVRTGNIGLAAVFWGSNDKVYTSADVIVIKNSKVSPFFISTFLNSKFGRIYLNRIIYGALQPHITPKLLGEIPLPIFSEKEIENIDTLVKGALLNLQEAELLYSQAENLLLEELGLKDFKVEDELCYIVNLSEVKSAHRADAEYFQPKYERLLEKIKYKKEKLSDLLSSPIKKGIEIGEEQYQDEGKLFIRVSNLSKQGIIDRDQKYLNEELYQKLKKDFQPKVGEVLLTKDATPGIAYVLKEPIEGIIASGILRLKLKEEIEPEYLALIINSIVGQYQVERDTGGSVILHWRPEQVEDFIVPILPKPIQQKIADLVQKSHEARKKAKQLLEQAKQRVEELIEK